ncbi:hypothetical protein HHX47_DHR1001017 [Lentinula edodes]|nr:hypothetical protein HHX47_DHR1001017 [Lentinula edodes]
MADEQDTDTLLALVSSLTHKGHSTEVMLDALVQAEGNPELASQILNRGHLGSEVPAGKKRKRASGLDSWLKGPNHAQPVSRHASSSSSAVPSSNPPIRKVNRGVDLMAVLKQPPPSKKTAPRKPTLILNGPQMVAEHTPCTMHLSVLPSQLASKLFYSLEQSSRDWQRNKWWLFDRLVESPHRTAFFVRKTDGVSDDETWHESAQYWYNGRKTDPPDIFSSEMEEACEIIERLVTEEIRRRPYRYPLEWAGGDVDSTNDLIWRANVAASNRYEGRNESVGWHSDHMTYLGPHCTIGGPDFKPPSIPLCKCGIPTVLRPDMKNQRDGQEGKYWWTCFAGAQNDGKSCGMWKVMDMEAEGRGPTVGDMQKTEASSSREQLQNKKYS